MPAPKPLAWDVDERGCFICTSHACNKFGYPKIKRNGRYYPANRFVYERMHGPIPRGIEIRHTCDNPMCINPAHLLAGTHAQNMRDMFERGRAQIARPGNKYSAKLTRNQVLAIRDEIKGIRGEKAALARRFNVARSTILLIASGKHAFTRGAD